MRRVDSKTNRSLISLKLLLILRDSLSRVILMSLRLNTTLTGLVARLLDLLGHRAIMISSRRANILNSAKLSLYGLISFMLLKRRLRLLRFFPNAIHRGSIAKTYPGEGPPHYVDSKNRGACLLSRLN